MTKVKEVLRKKGLGVITIEEDQTALAAVEKMVEYNVGSLLVLQKNIPLGIITERDFLRQVTLQDKRPEEIIVKQIMSKRLVCVDAEFSVKECLAIMTEKRFRHLPVMDGGKLAGLVSIGDLVKQISSDQAIHINYLNDYISGKYPA